MRSPLAHLAHELDEVVVVDGGGGEAEDADDNSQLTRERRDQRGLATPGRSVEEVAAPVGDAAGIVPYA